MSTICKISVIIPIYNVEKFLDRCVSSVVNQTLRDIEIILVDDGSPDRCPQMCDEWAKQDSRIKVIHKNNAGLGYARNSGIDVASGEYITFLDSDDYVELDTYKTAYDEASSKKLDICYFQYCRFYDNGKKIDKRNIRKKDYYFGRDEVDMFLLDMIGPRPCEKIDIKHSMSACMGIYRAQIIKDRGIRFVSEKEIASEDLLFHIDLLPYVSKIGCLPDIFYNYYVNQHSITTTYSDAKRERMLKLLDVVKEKLVTNFPAEKFLQHFYTQILRIYKIIFRYEFLKDSSYKEKRKTVNTLCSFSFLQEMYQDVVCKEYSVKNRFIIFCMKYRFVFPLYVLYRMKKS